ncbi:Clp protease N-terminal domain-containing protein [Streptomyces sp. NPDC051567]|uniref:Clp protease N-terminal domain-containing protein n=1 Tax=Streptomyces sp. NPDC051567 TaxID=3365660 RepID=UPI00378D18A7
MFEYFTDRAKQSLIAAQDEALSLGHDFIGTGHLLLGLAATTDSDAGVVLAGQGVGVGPAREVTVRLLEAAGVPATGGQPTRDALSSLGIDITEIERRADDNFGPGAFRFPQPAYTSHAKKALEQTIGEARTLGQERFGTGHILLALLTIGTDDAEVTATDVLTTLDVDLPTVRPAVLARITDA